LGKQPDWEGIKLYSRTARELFGFIYQDYNDTLNGRNKP